MDSRKTRGPKLRLRLRHSIGLRLLLLLRDGRKLSHHHPRCSWHSHHSYLLTAHHVLLHREHVLCWHLVHLGCRTKAKPNSPHLASSVHHASSVVALLRRPLSLCRQGRARLVR